MNFDIQLWKFPSKSVKSPTGFLLEIYGKECEERNKLREGGTKKRKESGLDDFENSQSLQVIKDAETTEWLPRTDWKIGIRGNTESVTTKP